MPQKATPPNPDDRRRTRGGARSRALQPFSAGSVLLFAFSFAAGLGAAAVVRQTQKRGPEGSGAAVSHSAKARVDVTVPGRAAEAERIFQEGVQLLSAQRSSEALERFTRAAALDPTDPRPHHGAGKVYSQLFLHDKAEISYRKALEADPAFRPSKENLAMLLHEKGRHGEAIALLREMEKESPDDPFIWGELAINSLALGKPAEAVALLEKYRTAKPRDAWGHAHLGKAYSEAGRTREAEVEYREALSIDSRFQIAHYWLAQLLTASKREAEAQPLLERYRRLRQLSTDEHQLKMALLQNSEDLNSLVGLARVQLLLGDTQESRATLERAQQIAPTDPRVVELEQIHARAKTNEPAAR